MTVVMLVLDGLGARSVTPGVMPTLTGWGNRGMIRPNGATSVLCASTYPNFASIVTGAMPHQHGLFTNRVVTDGTIRSGSEVGPAVPSFFDEDSEVVVGDQNLIGVVAARSAGRHWPPSGVLPAGTSVDQFGYVTDDEVAGRTVAALDRRPEFLFVQLNSPDTMAHIHGPDSEEATNSYRSLDDALAVIDTALDLERDMLLVTSDHDQESIDSTRRVDLETTVLVQGIEVTVVEEGTAAMLVGPGADKTEWLDAAPGVADWVAAGPGMCLAFTEPGWWFAGPDSPDLKGAHGGPRTRATIAVAAGPSWLLESIRPKLVARRFGAEDWFGLVETVRLLASGR